MIRMYSLPTLMILFAFACATNPEKATSNRKVIDQTPGTEGIPKWAKSGSKFNAEEGHIGFKGFLTMDPDSRPDACTHAAGVDAKGRISALISSTIMDESGISGDDKTLVYNRLTAILSKQKLSGIEIADEYWNLVEIDDGVSPKRKLECWAKVTIKQDTLDKAMERALKEIGDDPSVKEHKSRLSGAYKKLEKSEGLSGDPEG